MANEDKWPNQPLPPHITGDLIERIKRCGCIQCYRWLAELKVRWGKAVPCG